MNKKIKKPSTRFERLTRFEFYMLVRMAFYKLPKRIRRDMSHIKILLAYDVFVCGDPGPMAEAYFDSHIHLYPHLIIFDAGVRNLSVADSLESVIEHEVAHLYGFNHKEINRRRKKNIPMFKGVRSRFSLKKGKKK